MKRKILTNIFKKIAVSSLIFSMNFQLVTININAESNYNHDNISYITKTAIRKNDKRKAVKDNILEVLLNREFVLEIENTEKAANSPVYERCRIKLASIDENSKLYKDYKDFPKISKISRNNFLRLYKLVPTHSEWTDWTETYYNAANNYNARFMILESFDTEKKEIQLTEYIVFNDPKSDAYGKDKGPLDLAIQKHYTLTWEADDFNEITYFDVEMKDSFDNEVSGKLYSVDDYEFESGDPDALYKIKISSSDLPMYSELNNTHNRMGTAKKDYTYNVRNIYKINGQTWYWLDNNSYITGNESQIEILNEATE